MKKKFLGFFVLILLVFLFTGCEQAINIPDEMAAVQAYDKEVIVAIMDELETKIPSDFTEIYFGTINEKISYIVDDYEDDEVGLIITLEKWVASDGTEISGNLYLDINYDSFDSSYVIDYLYNYAYLIYEGTVARFNENIFNDTSVIAEFTFENNGFICYSLTIDGESIIDLDYYSENRW
jgi:hypothetical protein